MFFFFFSVNAGGQCWCRWSTPEVNAGGQRADVALARGDAWGTRGTWGARGARGSVARERRVGSWHAERVRARGNAWERVERVGARCRTSGGAWARVWRAKNFWRRVGARTRSDPADFGLNGQIVMRSIQ